MLATGNRAAASILFSRHIVTVPSRTGPSPVAWFSSSLNKMAPNVALLLSGCGVYDGTEITEAVSTIVHLSRSGADVKMFAPDKKQMHIIDHTSGEEMEGERNCLIESARIARGKISPLDNCKANEFDALVIPGGFGAAKNLSDFAIEGSDMTVDPLVKKTIDDFVSMKKPIGFCCIAPVLAARVIPGVKLTVGSDEESEKYPFAGAAGAIDMMGGKHEVCETHKALVDEDKKVVTSCAYMYNGKPHEIDDSVRAMVEGVLKMVGKD